jgi:hypothetical protein
MEDALSGIGNTPTAPRSPLEHRQALLQGVLLAAMILVIAALSFGCLHRLFLHVPRDDNEGWNAYQALTALSGGVLYPPPDSYITDNYPPLSFYLVGFVGRWIGDNIFAGRLLALLSEIAVAFNVFLLVRRLGGERFYATFSSLLFLLYIATNMGDYVAMDDPQWLGHAFVTSGAVLFLRAQTARRFRLITVLSSLLCVAGILTKHNLIILPLALFLWALCVTRQRVMLWTATSLLLGSIALWLGVHTYGVNMLRDILEHQRALSFAKFARDLGLYSAPLSPLLLAIAVLGVLDWRDRSVKFLLLYAGVAGVIGAMFLAGAGIDVNVLFDLVIALSMAAGLFLRRLVPMLASRQRPFAPAIGAAVIAGVCCTSAVHALLTSRTFVQEDRAERLTYQSLIATIAATPGPVACEQLTLCYWAGRRFELDFSNYGKKLTTGAVSPDALRRRFDSDYYALVQTVGPPAEPRGTTARLLGNQLAQDLGAHYRVIRRSDEEFLLAPDNDHRNVRSRAPKTSAHDPAAWLIGGTVRDTKPHTDRRPAAYRSS